MAAARGGNSHRCQRMRRLRIIRHRLVRRRDILLHWLGGRRNGEGLLRVLAECASLPASFKARLRIRKIEAGGGFLVVHFRGLGDPLHFPAEMDAGALYQVIAELMYRRSWHYYEIPQTRVLPGDVVADCGAGEGLFSLLVARRCRKVYAVEPLGAFVAAMRRTFAGLANVEVVPYALGEREGEAIISEEEIASGLGAGLAPGAGRGRRVKVTTLDAIFARRGVELSYLKADLEGLEMELLRGGRETIRRFSPKIAITTYHRKDHAELIAGFLKEIDGRYRIRVKGIHHPTGAPVMLHAWVP